MPQTKFVLKKALDLGLKVIVVINKIDKASADIRRTINETTNLFLQLAVEEHHLDFPIMYAIGREGKAWDHLPTADEIETGGDLKPLFEKIIEYIPVPSGDTVGGLQLLVAALDRDNYQGRYAIGKLVRGVATNGQQVTIVHPDGKRVNSRIEKVFVYQGLNRVEVTQAEAGDIVAITGAPESHIGDTIADAVNPEALPTIRVEEPTLRITIGPNTSPFVGRDGTLLTGRQIGERIERELETNIGFRMTISDPSDSRAGGRYTLAGRGELHLSVFIETLRREGFELEISKPEVIFKEETKNDKREPIEEITVDVPEEFVGAVTTEFGKRTAQMVDLINHGSGYSRLVWHMPTRAFLGLRAILMTATKGTVVINSIYLKHEPLWNLPPRERTGALVASESGQAVAFGLEVAQGRGITFVAPGTPVYEGMIIGQNSRREDMEINVAKGKALSNMRSKGSDGITILTPPVIMSLEQALDWIEDDELLEVTPKDIRFRKRGLTRVDRDRANRSAKASGSQ